MFPLALQLQDYPFPVHTELEIRFQVKSMLCAPEAGRQHWRAGARRAMAGRDQAQKKHRQPPTAHARKQVRLGDLALHVGSL